MQQRQEIEDVVLHGAKLFAKSSEAVRSCRVVLICVLDYATIYEIFKSVAKTDLAGKMVVNLTNYAPRERREINF